MVETLLLLLTAAGAATAATRSVHSWARLCHEHSFRCAGRGQVPRFLITGSGSRTLGNVSASAQLQGALDTLSSSCFQPYLQAWAACLGDQRPGACPSVGTVQPDEGHRAQGHSSLSSGTQTPPSESRGVGGASVCHSELHGPMSRK